MGRERVLENLNIFKVRCKSLNFGVGIRENCINGDEGLGFVTV
jgi:hypothetical protein